MRLQLDAEDLAKVRMSSTWGPFNEALLSLGQLRDPRPKVLIDGWRRTTRGHLGEWIAPLVALTPPEHLLDLHTVVGEAASIDHALERLEAAPADHLSDELTCQSPWLDDAGSWARRWLRDLAAGNRHARRELIRLIERYHRSAIEPTWSVIEARLRAERARCGRVVASGGIGELLGSLHPRVRWRPPFLDVDLTASRRPTRQPGPTWPTAPDEPPQVLDGRSVVLVPSVFCLDGPSVMRNVRDETAPRLLLYPVLRDLGDAAALWVGDAAPGPGALARLLGPTRAAALDALADVCTTTELARRLGVSPATASHHAGVLRDARLIQSTRQGNAVHHRLAPLGAALLDGRHDPPAPDGG